MNKIILTADSGVCPIDLPIIPAQISDMDGNSYRDTVEISNGTIIDRINNGETFKTSSPVMKDYENTFVKYLSEGCDVIHLSMSSGISEGSVNASNLMAKQLEDEFENKVYVIDTLTGATGGTLISEIAKKLVKCNLSTNEILTQLELVKKHIATSFYVPDARGFIRSGRNKSKLCLKDRALEIGSYAASKAHIKFRVNFNEEGNLFVKSIVRGSTNGAMQKLTQTIINDSNKHEFDPSLAVIGNLRQTEVNMNQLREYLVSLAYFDSIVERDISGVVASYGCNDLCGISLIKK